jgi:hypothetical protein
MTCRMVQDVGYRCECVSSGSRPVAGPGVMFISGYPEYRDVPPGLTRAVILPKPPARGGD